LRRATEENLSNYLRIARFILKLFYLFPTSGNIAFPEDTSDFQRIPRKQWWVPHTINVSMAISRISQLDFAIDVKK
jgi:hypothetical protein